jgi:hypothetical protein
MSEAMTGAYLRPHSGSVQSTVPSAAFLICLVLTQTARRRQDTPGEEVTRSG